MTANLKIGRFELYWLDGGSFELDGGAMFGVVPKVLWSKKYPATEDNFISLVASPILVKAPDALVLIETGLGNKLTEKQKKIFRVTREWMVPEDLEKLGIKREDIDYVILTHCDFDHSGGIVMKEDDGMNLTFPRAKHLIQRKEWEDVKNPNRRSAHTFWEINFKGLEESGVLELVDEEAEVIPGLRVIHTGGHNRGHQVVRIEDGGEVALHLADLLPTHVHFNPLWVMAYDNFPLEVIRLKEELETSGIKDNAWFTFYHDPFVRACRFDEKGEVRESLRL